ncbi:hypothetical protein C8Q79DRAFT_99153 [Trametes meyenii]|nr:hypothetical protein C8Q79DRAFT_99153 [Trametes meyenii]
MPLSQAECASRGARRNPGWAGRRVWWHGSILNGKGGLAYGVPPTRVPPVAKKVDKGTERCRRGSSWLSRARPTRLGRWRSPEGPARGSLRPDPPLWTLDVACAVSSVLQRTFARPSGRVVHSPTNPAERGAGGVPTGVLFMPVSDASWFRRRAQRVECVHRRVSKAAESAQTPLGGPQHAHRGQARRQTTRRGARTTERPHPERRGGRVPPGEVQRIEKLHTVYCGEGVGGGRDI